MKTNYYLNALEKSIEKWWTVDTETDITKRKVAMVRNTTDYTYSPKSY
jgi:hypothetical protein